MPSVSDGGISREINTQELAQYEIDQTAAKAEANAVATQTATKLSAIAKLVNLGLTPDEAATL